MAVTNSGLRELPDDQRDQVEAILFDFESSWNQNRFDELVDSSVSLADEVRWALLIEAIKVDLEKRWELGDRVGIEWYENSVPNLSPVQRCAPADLVQAEYEIRSRYSGTPDASIKSRFPKQAAELETLFTLQSTQVNLLRDTSTPTPQSPVETIPEMLGRYRVGKQIGSGGMATVFWGWDTVLDREVAIKVPNNPSHPLSRERLQREASAGAKFRHPRICPVYDFESSNGISFLTMAYIKGQAVSELFDGPMNSHHAVALVRDIAETIHCAHENGVIHRDLKPSNVIIDEHGHPILTDFGLAQFIHQTDTQATIEGTPIGTPCYMAPEQVAGRLREIGPHTDVYALGAILFELLAGRPPFQGAYGEVIADVVHAAPPPLKQFNDEVDAVLQRICHKALSKSPEQRFPSAKQMAVELSKWESQSNKQSRTTQKNFPAKGLMIAAVITLLIPLGWALNRARNSESATSAESSFERRVTAISSIHELNKALAGAQPGEVLELAPGEYSGSIRFDRVNGTPANMIEIVAANPDQPPKIRSIGEPAVSGSGVGFRIANLDIETDNLGIEVQYSQYVVLDNIRLRIIETDETMAVASGIQLKSCDTFVIQSCEIDQSHFGYGIHIRDCRAGCISGCRVNETISRSLPNYDSVGIGMEQSSHLIEVAGCELVGFNRAIQLGGNSLGENREFHSDTANRIFVVNNLIQKCDAPFVFFSCGHCEVKNNTVDAPKKFLFRIIREGEQKLHDNSLAFNLFKFENARIDSGTSDLNSVTLAPNLWCSPSGQAPFFPLELAVDIAGQETRRPSASESNSLSRNGQVFGLAGTDHQSIKSEIAKEPTTQLWFQRWTHTDTIGL